jgi:Arc/MetJ family transcription regulator
MAKTKTTVYIDEDVLRGAKVMAARTGKKDYEVVEEALRAYLGMNALDRAWGATDMPEDEALRLAVEEVHRFRSGSS